MKYEKCKRIKRSSQLLRNSRHQVLGRESLNQEPVGGLSPSPSGWPGPSLLCRLRYHSPSTNTQPFRLKRHDPAVASVGHDTLRRKLCRYDRPALESKDHSCEPLRVLVWHRRPYKSSRIEYFIGQVQLDTQGICLPCINIHLWCMLH